MFFYKLQTTNYKLREISFKHHSLEKEIGKLIFSTLQIIKWLKEKNVQVGKSKENYGKTY